MGEAQLNRTALSGAITRAIDLVTEALTILDEVEAPGDIGAHLDLALHRMMREELTV